MGEDSSRHSGAGLTGRLTALTAAAALAIAAQAVAGGRARAAAHSGGAAGAISTMAGSVGGPARATRVALAPCGVTFGGGSLYAGDGFQVRKISPQTGRLTTPAGVGSAGPLADGKRAARAAVDGACEVAVDRSRNLVIADQSHQRVRVVAARTGRFYDQAMTAGHIYTIAGNGTQGYSGDGRRATRAELSLPSGVAVDHAGNIVVADTFNQRIRVVAARTGRFYGRAMAAGDIYAVAGNGTQGYGGDGRRATAAMLSFPFGVTVDRAGNLVAADSGNERIRVVAARTGRFYGRGMTAGDIYTVAGNGAQGYNGDGRTATRARLSFPQRVRADGAGNLVIADTNNARVRVVAARTARFYGQSMTAGDIYTVAGNGTRGFAGDGSPATAAELTVPGGVAVDGAGNLVIADTGNDRIRVAAAQAGRFYGRAMTAGDIYTIAGNGTLSFSGEGGLAAGAQLSGPQGVTRDRAGNLVIADTGNDRVRVVAARTGRFYGRAMMARHIYTVAGDGGRGFAGDEGPAVSAEFWSPSGVAVDRSGNLLVADTFNGRVRLVAASTGSSYGQSLTAGDIYTLAGGGTGGLGDGGPAASAELLFPGGVTVDKAGNVVIADTSHGRIRVVAVRSGHFYGQSMTAGDIYTVAGGGTGGIGEGGPATDAQLAIPQGVAADRDGSLVIGDAGHHRVRVVAGRTGRFYGRAMVAGHIYTVAGNGTRGYSGDGRRATAARLSFPQGVAVDGRGNLVIADPLNQRVRVVAVRAGRFYGRVMATGDIYTVAGNGMRGFAGDGGPAARARLWRPFAVAIGGAGSLLIADTDNSRIRRVAG